MDSLYKIRIFRSGYSDTRIPNPDLDPNIRIYKSGSEYPGIRITGYPDSTLNTDRVGSGYSDICIIQIPIPALIIFFHLKNLYSFFLDFLLLFVLEL